MQYPNRKMKIIKSNQAKKRQFMPALNIITHIENGECMEMWESAFQQLFQNENADEKTSSEHKHNRCLVDFKML